MNATVNLGELAQVVGRSEVTLRKLMARHEDFPIVSRGSNGVAYLFDARAVMGWLDDHEAADRLANDERRAELAQLQLELSGGTADGDRVLTAKERKEALEVAYAEAKWREAQGALIDADLLDRALVDAFAAIRIEVMRLPETLRRVGGLDRDQVVRMDQACRQSLEQAAARLAHDLGRLAEAAE